MSATSDELRYVYAVCRPLDAPLAADLTGVGGVPPRQLNHEGLVALVGPVPARDFAEDPLRAHLEDLDWLSETARAHQRVIGALTSVTCPLPLRLATVFRDDSGVRAMLQDGAERFWRILDRIDGCVEWGVKVHMESPDHSSDNRSSDNRTFGGHSSDIRSSDKQSSATAGGEAPEKPLSGRDYLRLRRQQRTAQDEGWKRAEAFAQRLHEELSRHADDARLHAPQNSSLSDTPGRNILNAAYLVPRAHSEEFVELVDATKDEDAAGLTVELTGPWAAYSFTGDDVESGGGAGRSR
ncbi:GvpL/GvpF family gas vesicle protein [Streptomyces alfalfae]|uniref:GvpL/GvpF family gas vesicle protein n=1 Tax=Streptomyces alfalfae TaxID=1642299 RepID=UPI001FD58F73|nr:GvpL/GvpF family gas vesicle protein [Streptomyces alfalfae]